MSGRDFEVEEVIGRVGEVLTEAQRRRGVLIQALQAAQEKHNYLPGEVLAQVAEELDLAVGEVYSTASFYRQFHFEPRGDHVVCVCVGTPCHVRGSGEVLDNLEQSLGVARGETTADLAVTLETVGCVGCCGLAPVVTVDGEVVGDVRPGAVEDILAMMAES
jgi:NADH:ubiquinone oxidoreductase subunit E